MRQISAAKSEYAQASNRQLLERSVELKFRAKSGESAERLVVPAFALVQEASHRVLGMRHFDVQLLAGLNLVSKCVIEMSTGEGKTLTALLPLYLHALYGKGSHLATANDYLARRDGQEMGPVFQLLGMRVGTVQNDSSDAERLGAYKADITYGTLAEFGFDFLRDRMKKRIGEGDMLPGTANADELPVGRGLHFVLVDEADSIMIDDASTPLIIGAMNTAEQSHAALLYGWAAKHAPEARERSEFRYIEHEQKVELSERGRGWVRQVAKDSVANVATVDQYEYMERAIKVERDYIRDRNYVVSDGAVSIIDNNTGRLAVGRFWQDGLHQAIQAREGLQITIPTGSAARLTVQSLVLSYPKRAGMTGTARPSRREFRKVYKMSVIRIPNRRPCQRRKMRTVICRDEQKKIEAIRDKIQELHQAGRPVLVGSRSVAKSEGLSELLTQCGIEHQILNARHEAQEASIVAQAGGPGVVTISTSMAGRGTDIKLGEHVEELGGLHVIIAELNDSLRVDRQLIGRCARQGDRGSYQLFLSPDDHVMDLKHKVETWYWLARRLPMEWVYRRAQAKINSKNVRDRLAMLHHEKKRLRSLRQAGLDPVLDVVG